MNTMDEYVLPTFEKNVDLLLLGVAVDHGYLPCINKDGRDKRNQCRHTVGDRVDGADCGILHGREERLIGEADNIHEDRIRHERQRVQPACRATGESP